MACESLAGWIASMVSQMKAWRMRTAPEAMYAEMSMQNDLLKEALGKKR